MAADEPKRGWVDLDDPSNRWIAAQAGVPADPARPDALDEKAVKAAEEAFDDAAAGGFDALRDEAWPYESIIRAAIAAYIAHADLVPRAEVEHVEALWRSAEARHRLRAELERAEREIERLRASRTQRLKRSSAGSGGRTMTAERSAIAVVRAYFQKIGLAGPTVAQAEQVIAALDEAGMLKRGVKR